MKKTKSHCILCTKKPILNIITQTKKEGNERHCTLILNKRKLKKDFNFIQNRFQSRTN